MTEASCLTGVIVLIIAGVVLTAYIITTWRRKVVGEFKDWMNSQAKSDESSGELVMTSDTRLARSVFVSVIAVIGVILGQLLVRDFSGFDAIWRDHPGLIVLISALAIFAAYGMFCLRLRYTYRFDKRGIREYRGTAQVGSTEWRNIETVEMSYPRFAIAIGWSDGVMFVPTSHRGVKDLLEAIRLNVPEARWQGIKKLIDRWGLTQSMLP